jgi:hypothetical protein
MSGPLASWYLAHNRAEHSAERFIVTALSLRAEPDGSCAKATNQQLADETGHHLTTVKEAIEQSIERGELERTRRGAGGSPSVYRFPIRWCPEEDDCPVCATLRKAQESRAKRSPQTTFQGQRSEPKRRKGSPQTRKRSPQTTPDGSPLKGEPSPHSKVPDWRK